MEGAQLSLRQGIQLFLIEEDLTEIFHRALQNGSLSLQPGGIGKNRRSHPSQIWPGLSHLAVAAGIGLLRCDVRSRAIDVTALLVPVVMTHPVGQIMVRAIFSAAFRSDVEIHVGAQHLFVSAAVGRVSVKDLAVMILIKDTQAR
jgi:hypothetical protein